ncbi:MAG: hypothetical protein U0324_22430 [Polyangiales bacterium]
MKLAFVGPAHGKLDSLRARVERCLFEWGCDRAFYLGSDDALDQAMAGWAERLGAPRDDAAFLDEVSLLAPDGDPDTLDALLARDARRRRLHDLAGVPGRHVEMIEDRILVVTGDAMSPDEDDLANAAVVVQGRIARPELRVVGGRALLMPGDLARHGHVGLVERVPQGARVSLHDADGEAVREVVVSLRRGARMEVRP